MGGVNDLDEDSDGECEWVDAPMENRSVVGVTHQFVPTRWMPVVYVQDERGVRDTGWGWWR